MAVYKRGNTWWYEFSFAGKRIRESAKTQRKTVASQAEKNRRLELERGYNNLSDGRKDNIRTVRELADEYFGVGNYPPAEPEALRLLAPQRGLIAIA